MASNPPTASAPIDLNIKYLPDLPKRKDFRIGCIGTGFIMADCHLVAYKSAGFNPVAIAARNVEKAAAVAQRHGIAKTHNTISDLLHDPSVEVVDIALPPDQVLPIVKEAVKQASHIKGILCQKPMGLNYGEAKQVVELCEKAGIVLGVNQNMRYDQSIRGCKDILNRGLLGAPVLATIDMRAIPHWMPWQEQMGWLTLRIMSIHHIDALRYLLGDPVRIYASARPDPRTKFPNKDGICLYIMEYANGARAASWDDVWTGPARGQQKGTFPLTGASRASTAWQRGPLAGPNIPPPLLPRSTSPPRRARATGSSRAGRKSGSPTPSSARWRSFSAPWNKTANPKSAAAIISKPWPSSTPATNPSTNTAPSRSMKFTRVDRATIFRKMLFLTEDTGEHREKKENEFPKKRYFSASSVSSARNNLNLICVHPCSSVANLRLEEL